MCYFFQGRTGVMICAYLLHTNICADSTKALDYYSQERTHDKKVQCSVLSTCSHNKNVLIPFTLVRKLYLKNILIF